MMRVSRLPWGTIILGTLFLLGLVVAEKVSGSTIAIAVFAGGIVPIIISVLSLLFWKYVLPRKQWKNKYERFNLMNFLCKMLLIGIWITLTLSLSGLPQMPFVLSLLINFILWHFYEAHYYQRNLLAAAEKFI